MVECLCLFLCCRSRHTVVCCAAQETWGARQASVYFTGVKKTPLSRICSSALSEQKHTKFYVWISLEWGTSFQIWAKSAKPFPRYAPSKFVLFSSYFSSFRNTFWNRYNSRMLWWIALKFGALLEHFRAYLKFNFHSNGINKYRVIIDFQNFQVQSFVTPIG